MSFCSFMSCYCRDVWAEDSTEPLLSIDLTECENVYPSASARNYGIEIKVTRISHRFTPAMGILLLKIFFIFSALNEIQAREINLYLFHSLTVFHWRREHREIKAIKSRIFSPKIQKDWNIFIHIFRMFYLSQYLFISLQRQRKGGGKAEFIDFY